MEQRIRRLGRLFTVLFLGQALVTGYWQMWRGADLALDPRNHRVMIAERRIQRGAILDRELRPLARTATTGGQVTRSYPYGPVFAHLTGFQSRRLGKAGIERAMDASLRGLQQSDLWTDLRELVSQTGDRRGEDVVLTVDATLQKAAWEALQGRRGAIVVLDPRDGAVLAMVSSPSFDPNTVDARWGTLRQTEGGPLVNRAVQGLYPPGSAFKVITLAAALSEGTATPETMLEDSGFIVLQGTRITNFEGRACGRVTAVRALVYSCNVAFIRLGLQLGGPALLEFARRFGLGQSPPFNLPAAAGHLPPASEVQGEGVAQMAFGQGSLSVSPLQMALVAATFARDGAVPLPFLVREIRAPTGEAVQLHQPGSVQVIDPAVAQAVTEAMIGVVRRGTGRAARVRGVTVAGKTGTATVPQGRSHAWFIGFAPAEAPRVVVAVVLEHGGVGGRTAAPAARAVLQAALEEVE